MKKRVGEREGSIELECQPKGKEEKIVRMMVKGNPVIYWIPSEQELSNGLCGR